MYACINTRYVVASGGDNITGTGLAAEGQCGWSPPPLRPTAAITKPSFPRGVGKVNGLKFPFHSNPQN